MKDLFNLYLKGMYYTYPYKNSMSNIHSEQMISAEVCLNWYRKDRGSLGVFISEH